MTTAQLTAQDTRNTLKGFVITYRGRPYSVVAEGERGCPAYQRHEWKTETAADFEFDENGDVLFQGSPAVGATSHTCRLQSWARGDA